MQTFLPYADFSRSAASLDDKRLNKQIVECYQILRAITDSSYGWQHHPIVNMWRGHTLSLYNYILEINNEYNRRTYRQETSTQHKSFTDFLELYIAHFGIHGDENIYFESARPPWLGYGPFHRSHRLNLIRKDFNYVRKFYTKAKTNDYTVIVIKLLSDEEPYLWYDSIRSAWYTTEKGKRTYI